MTLFERESHSKETRIESNYLWPLKFAVTMRIKHFWANAKRSYLNLSAENIRPRSSKAQQKSIHNLRILLQLIQKEAILIVRLCQLEQLR